MALAVDLPYRPSLRGAMHDVATPRPPEGVAMAEFSLFIRRYAPFESFGGGFEGDSRGFSTDINATARTVGIASINIATGDPGAGEGYSDGSSFVGPWGIRKSLRLGAIGHHRGQVRAAVTNVSNAAGTLKFTIETSGNLPLKDILLHNSVARAIDSANSRLRPGSPAPQGAPNIDTWLDLELQATADVMTISGVMRGDGFPNAEAFIVCPTGVAAGLLDYRTSSGIAGPVRLLRAHPDTRRATFKQQIPLNPDGGILAGVLPIVVQET